MKPSPLLLLRTCAADGIDGFGIHWTVPLGSEWKLEEDGGAPALRMLAARGPDKDKPRSPQQFALSSKQYDSFALEADVTVLRRSLIIVHAYRDEAHFNYAHLSTDTAIFGVVS